MVSIPELVDDFVAENDELDAMVAPLDDLAWRNETPAPGFTIQHQIAHLATFDAAAVLAITDRATFDAHRQTIDLYSEKNALDVLLPLTALGGEDLLHRWRDTRVKLEDALLKVPTSERIPWYGPAMSPASMVTARIMETWAHGQDVADALGVTRIPSWRLRHVARLACLAIPYSFRAHGLAVPSVPIRVDLWSEDDRDWSFGDAGAINHVSGSLQDFCLVMTRRRHPSDVRLQTRGVVANRWVAIGQTFAGPPGKGRHAGQFRTTS
ncbi:TIGR03084 family metal-binding protein [Herbiconiux sp. P16]|uniref:TIGR03084 family metal-binding protein n=1 Tax=Herbiconiux wuyangfengii TaxID=3342794 RepID=UPI0035BB377D